jgi:hypothetical protein
MFVGDFWLTNGRSWSKEAAGDHATAMEHPGWRMEIHGKFLSGWLSRKNFQICRGRGSDATDFNFMPLLVFTGLYFH